MATILATLASVKVIKHHIPAHGLTPNCDALDKPLLLYRSAFLDNASTTQMEEHLRKVDVVVPQWRYTMYSTSHFHSTTHEVLIIANGRAKLCFGHEDNPARVIETVQKGDAVVIPAGVAHRLMDDLEGGFQMIGSYPKGKNWDMCYGRDDEADRVKRIQDLNWFEKDPIFGREGPLSNV